MDRFYIDALAGTPIAFAHTGDGEWPYRAIAGGVTLLVRVNDFPAEPLYSLYVDGTHAADLDDWPAAWRRPPVPDELRELAAQTPRGAALVAVTAPLDADALRSWATVLCTTPATDSVTVLRALRFAGPPRGTGQIESPPAQTSVTEVIEEDGALIALRFVPGPVPVTRGDLETVLGTGRDDDDRVRYRVAVDDAPFTCEIVALFGDGATEIVLERRRA